MCRISILIPTYAFAPLRLVGELADMCTASPLCDDYEISVIDDGSGDTKTIAQAEAINRLPHCSFTALPHHLGKSALLNRAAAAAKYPLLLLVDSDARMYSPQLITTYLKTARANPAAVICGGVHTSPQSVTPDNRLRFRYEMAAAARNKDCRWRQHPYSRFTTFNMMLQKKLLSDIPFNEDLRSYGYEDTMFGLQLRQHGIPVIHIDNPLIHTGIDNNASFLAKTETALRNLSKLDAVYQQSITVSAVAMQIRRFGLAAFFRVLHTLFRGCERRNLLGKHPNLLLFKLYKIGYFLSLTKR